MLQLSQTRATRRSAFRRAFLNEVNVSPVSRLARYVSSCSSGNRLRGRQHHRILDKEIFPRRAHPSRRVFKLLNDLSSLRHPIRSTSLCSSDDRPCASCRRVRCSNAENTWLSALEICATEETCQSRYQQSTVTAKHTAWPHRNTSIL